MVNYYESFRPSVVYSEANRSRSSSVSRYSSPARSNYGSSSRAGTPLASYGISSLRTLLQETNNSAFSSRRSSLSSTSGSSRRSSFGTESPAPKPKHIHFKEEETKESDHTTSMRSDQGILGFESNQRFNREREPSIPRTSFEDTSDSIRKMSIRGRFDVPSASCDASRRRQARAAYLSALDDTGITVKSRDKM